MYSGIEFDKFCMTVTNKKFCVMKYLRTFPLLASLFLIGCQTTQWVKHGDPTANLERDQYECKRDAYGMVRTPNAVVAPSPTIPSTYSTNCNMLGNSAYCNTTQTNSYTQALIAQSNQQMAQGWAALGASIDRQNLMNECMRSKGWRQEVVETQAASSRRSGSNASDSVFVPDFGAKGYSRPSSIGQTSDESTFTNKSTSIEFDPYDSAFYQLDRRTASAVTTDSDISTASDAFASKLAGGQSSASVLSFNRRVLVAGTIQDAEKKQKLIEYVSKLKDVQLVIDEIRIGDALSVGNKSKDQLILKELKTQILRQDEEMAVVRGTVVNGVVYLMGIVSTREADRIVEIARRIPSVRQVTPAFEVISERELAVVKSGITAANRPKKLTISSQDAVQMLLQLKKKRDSGEISMDEYENKKEILMQFI